MPRPSLLLTLLAVLLAGACLRAEPPPGPLTEAERRALPGRVAFVAERGGRDGHDAPKDVWLLTPSTGALQPLSAGPADEYPAAVLPGGRGLVLVAAREADGRHFEQLLLQPLDGTAARPLSPPRGRARNPSVSPDGRWLVAESDAVRFSDVVRVPLTGGGAEQPLTEERAGAFEPALSPDGREVAYVSSREGDPELYVRGVEGGAERRLTHFHAEDWGPRWSPDGRWLAFLSHREGRDRVYLVRPDGTGLRALSGGAPTGDESELAWSPDGTRVAFRGRAPAGDVRLWVATLDGKDARPLTDGKARDANPAWSPDGRYVAFASDRAGDTDLYLVRADGSGLTRLTTAPGADWLPRWFDT